MNEACPRMPSLALLLLTLLTGRQAAADPPAAPPPAEAPAAPPSGSFFSTLKQAFKQDLDKEVVRGHFDLGSPPDARRYYCLIDTKTGRREDNGVTGQPTMGSDGMTRIKEGAVSLYPCADAERLGILVTSGYALVGEARTVEANRAAQPAEAAKTAGAADALQKDMLAVFGRFVAGLNAHDRIAVAGTLSDSPDFILAQSSGASIRGRDRALDAFAQDWQRSGALDPQAQEAQVSLLAPDAALLALPVSQPTMTRAAPADAVRTRWAALFVKTRAGWRIGSVVLTPIGPAP